MRIGVLLSGHLRSFRTTKSSFCEFITRLREVAEVDVFCHSWDIEESQTGSWWKKDNGNTDQPDRVNKEELIKTYSPVVYKIEQSKEFDASGYTIPSPVPIAGYLSMFYTVNAGYKIFTDYCNDKNVKYDILIRTRYDLDYEFAESFLDTLDEILLDKKIHMPNSNPYEKFGGYSDVFAIGPAPEMKTYFEFYSNFKEAVNYYSSLGYKELFPELCLPLYLKSRSIRIKRLEKLRLSIVRKNGDRFLVNSDKHFKNNSPVCFFKALIEKYNVIVPSDLVNIEENKDRLVRLYISWLDPTFNEQQLDRYLRFYKGHWISVGEITSLIETAKQSSTFEPGVMKSFFEEALRDAKYGAAKKLLLASLLAFKGDHGAFFFRLLLSLSRKKDQEAVSA